MLPCCLYLAALAPAAPADAPPSLRQLCIRAPLVVLARPADPLSPTRFTALAVLRGRGVQPGDDLRPAGLSEAQVRGFDEPDIETKKPRPRRVDLALLFLEPTDGPSYRVMPTGFRFCTDDGRVLAPAEKAGEPARVADGVKWPALVQQVRGDVNAVDRLRAARRHARPRERVRALTDWLQRRRGELVAAPAAPGSDLSPAGWSELATDVFDWIFEDATPAEAWAVVRLHAAVHRGEAPPLKPSPFSSPEGRALLLGVALDGKQLAGDRARAAGVLVASSGLGGAGDAERSALLEKLRPALAERDAEVQARLARAVVALAGDRPAPTRLVNALAAAYRQAEPGAGRDELALTLYRLSSPEQYREITSNPGGVCVRLAEFSHEGDDVSFFLELRTGAAKVLEQPALVIEKLTDAGAVAETKREPLAVLNLERPWAEGVGDATLAVRLDLSKLVTATVPQTPQAPQRTKPPPIAYRLRVEGAVGSGKERRVWRSEPRRVWVAPVHPNQHSHYDR